MSGEEESGAAPIPAPRDGAECVGGAAPGPQGRETGSTALSGVCTAASGGGVVFIDFGRNRVYALKDCGEEVMVFDGLVEVVERLSPAVIVVDNLPRTQQKAVEGLAKKEDIKLLRLRDLRKLSEERGNNGIRKSDENDVRLLRELYRRRPELFQPLFESPDELKVRALTELWLQQASLKKVSKQTRTVTNHALVVEIHRLHRRMLERLASEIHEEAMKLPLYRMAFEKLGLKGPALAYIAAHDGVTLATLPRDRLEIRYGRAPSWGRRSKRSQLLTRLAMASIQNKHPRYRAIYEHYRRKGKSHWPALIRTAKIMLRDLMKLAKMTQRA